MSDEISTAVGTALRETVPFLAITIVWAVIMLLFYGVFLLARPAGADYDPAIHASVFAPPLIGFLGHTLRIALRPA